MPALRASKMSEDSGLPSAYETRVLNRYGPGTLSFQPLIQPVVLSNLATLQYPYPLIRLQA